MAIVNVLQTVTFLDADGNRSSMPLYYVFDDTSLTLAQLRSEAQTNVSQLDAISDGQVVGTTLTLSLALPGGLKASPAAGSNVQETGLNTFNLITPAGKAFAYDIPAIAQVVLSGKTINQGNAGWQAWRDRIVNQAISINFRNNLWNSSLLSIRTAVKTFRK